MQIATERPLALDESAKTAVRTRRVRKPRPPKPTWEEKFAAMQECIDAVRAGAEYHENELAFAFRTDREPPTIKCALLSYGMCSEDDMEVRRLPADAVKN